MLKLATLLILILVLAACAPSGSTSGSAFKAADAITGPIPSTVSEIAAALSGKFILADGTHSIDFQGTQVFYSGTANTAKHQQYFNPGPGVTTRNWQCVWQGTFNQVLDFTSYKAVSLAVTSSTSANVTLGAIQNCMRTITSSFTIEFTSPTCFQAGFALETEKLVFCKE